MRNKFEKGACNMHRILLVEDDDSLIDGLHYALQKRGFAVDVAVREAKAYVAGALADGLDLGRGSGPLNHMWRYGPVPC